jgi:hypothetical protein
MQAILTALMRMACAARTTFFMKISACKKRWRQYQHPA